MSNLITSDRALSNLNNRATTDDENTTIAALIAAVSSAIENYCWQTFAVVSYDELYPGTHKRELVLRNYPTIEIDRVAYCPLPVVQVTNTYSDYQRATVKVTATGVELTAIASGVATITDIAFADQPTLYALATAITALGNKWAATVLNPADNLRASADLRALQGAYQAMNALANLKLHTSELTGFTVDAERGILTRDDGLLWEGGLHYWRVIYQAGYSEVPDDVQEACAEWAAQLFWQTKRDPGLASETIPGTDARVILQNMPTSTKLLLGPYRNWRV
jgi:hypothetical protein